MTDPLRRATGLSVREFSDAYWGSAPLVRRAAELPAGGFADLLSPSAIDELLSRRGLRTPFVRMTRDGEMLPPVRFTRGGGAGAEIADQIADDKVLAELDAGATLVLQALHRTWSPIREFASELAAQLGHPVQVNAYITPPQNTGFAPHYDVHDVFVLQFAGRKHWRVHEPVLKLPLRGQPWQDRKGAVAARCAETPVIDRVLEPGDALYLPRGYVHAATSLGELSGHLTVGVHPLTRRMLADRIIAALDDELELRHALPIGVDLSDPAILDGELDATLAALRSALERVDRVAIARGVGAHLTAATRPAPLRPLEQIAAANALGPGDAVRVRPGLRATVRCDGADLVIGLPDREIRLPLAFEEAARAATSGRNVSAETLPGVDAARGATLLARLLREGIVVPA